MHWLNASQLKIRHLVFYQVFILGLVSFVKWVRRQGCQMVYFSYQKQIWVIFGGPWNGKCWYILWSFGIIFGRLV
jgi:hypothetical protein